MLFYNPRKVFSLLKLIGGTNASLDELLDECFFRNFQSEWVLLQKHAKFVRFFSVFKTVPFILILNRGILTIKKINQSFILKQDLLNGIKDFLDVGLLDLYECFAHLLDTYHKGAKWTRSDISGLIISFGQLLFFSFLTLIFILKELQLDRNRLMYIISFNSQSIFISELLICVVAPNV